MKLKNLKKIPFEIATILANNNIIQKLIYDDSPSCLENKTTVNLSVEELINYHYVNFYSATESGIKEIDRNTFLIINMEDFIFNGADQNTNATGAVYITTDSAHSLLTNNRIRLLELMDIIESELSERKLSSAGTLQVTSASYVVFSDFRSGYRINIRCIDQQSQKAEL